MTERLKWGKTREQRLAHHRDMIARFGVGPLHATNHWGDPMTPATVSEFHTDPARRMTYYTGFGQPSKANSSPAPVFLSATTLNRYTTRGEAFPITPTCGWAGDSGAFTAIDTGNQAHPWHLDWDDFGGMVTRLMECAAVPPDFFAPQDWPCEPIAREKTGLTVRAHQQLTLENYLYLRREFPFVPWIPVLQGWRPVEYLEHVAMYERAGVDLAAERTVGLGSVCRRGSDKDIAELVEMLAARGFALHGFGVSIKGLRRIGHLLASSDSQAWSKTARDERIMLPGCDHRSRPDRVTGETRPTDCRNCLRYAMAYREEVLQAVRDSSDAAYRRRPAAPAPRAPRYDQFPLCPA